MAERPTNQTAHPPAVFFTACAVGLIALVAAVSVSTLTGPARYILTPPLLLLGFVMWSVAVLRFVKWSNELQQARDAAAHAAVVDPEPGRRYSPLAQRLPGQRPSPGRRRVAAGIR